MTAPLVTVRTYEPEDPDDDPIDDDGLQPADVAAEFQASHLVSPQGLTLRRYRGSWWRWGGRCYAEVDDETLSTEILKYLLNRRTKEARKKAKSAFVRDVLANLRIDTLVPPQVELPAWLSYTPPSSTRTHLSLENGILDIERALTDGNPLVDHTPNFMTTITLPYAFEPYADCPRWKRTLDWVLPEADKQRALQQFAGYVLSAGHYHQTCLILTGEGSNGKSTILDALTWLYGAANVSSVPLDKFEKPFSLFQMLGKLVNIAPDMGEIEKTAEGVLKSLISGDRIDWERKYHDAISAPPTAKLIFACNELPRFMDKSEGIWRRLLIIPFEVTITEAQREPDIREALMAELPGIFIWALAGLHDLRRQGHFTIPEASATVKEDLRLESNPARAFLLENYIADDNDWVLRTELYEDYKKYCAANGHRALGERRFGKEIRRAFPNITEFRPREGTDRPRYHSGIKKREA